MNETPVTLAQAKQRCQKSLLRGSTKTRDTFVVSQIIYDIHIDRMPQTQKRDLIVTLGSEHHINQWRSTPHFRQAAMHIIRRERSLLRSRGDNEVTTTQLLNNLCRKAEGLLR